MSRNATTVRKRIITARDVGKGKLPNYRSRVREARTMTRNDKVLLLIAAATALVLLGAFLGSRSVGNGLDTNPSTLSAIPAIASATIIGLGSLAVAAYTQRQTYRQKADENFFHALNWLTGGSQKRNLAIAAIEAYWQDERFREISIPLLSNSAIYLLLESNQGNAAHELNNLTRMMTLLLSIQSLRVEYRSQYAALLEAVTTAEGRAERRLEGKQEKGLHVNLDELRSWRTRLDSH
jgi:hypothetical protein